MNPQDAGNRFVTFDKEAFRHARTRLGLTQDQLATKAGCSKRTIENIENGKQTTLRVAHEVCAILKVNVSELTVGGRRSSTAHLDEVEEEQKDSSAEKPNNRREGPAITVIHGTVTLRRSLLAKTMGLLRSRKFVLIAILLVTTLTFACWLWLRPEQPYVAVLPFRNVDGSKDTQLLSDGLSEVLPTLLTELRGGHHITFAPASEVRGNNVTDASAARQRIGVDLLLTGSLSRSTSGVLITINLVDTKSRRQLRSTLLKYGSTALNDMQLGILRSVLKLLDVPPSQATLDAITTHSLKAYESYIAGYSYLKHVDKPEQLKQAASSFRGAIEADPSYALGYAGLCEALWAQYFWSSRSTPALVDEARQACKGALQRDPQLSYTWKALGRLHTGVGQYAEAVDAFRQALEINPLDDGAIRGLATAHDHLTNVQKAEELYGRAISLEDSWANYNSLAGFYYRHGKYQQAIRAFQDALDRAPDNSRVLSNVGALYVLVGQYPDAISVLQRSLSLQKTPDAYSNIGSAYYFMHEFTKAVEAYDTAITLGSDHHRTWANLGDAQRYAGRPEHVYTQHYKKAIALSSQQLSVNPNDSQTLLDRATYQVKVKAFTSARDDMINSGYSVSQANTPEIAIALAIVYESIGERVSALAAVRRALETGCPPSRIVNDKDFDTVRKDSRFDAIRRDTNPVRKGK